jgi:hypothetical protein
VRVREDVEQFHAWLVRAQLRADMKLLFMRHGSIGDAASFHWFPSITRLIINDTASNDDTVRYAMCYLQSVPGQMADRQQSR